MSLKDYAVMPYSDYKGACDAIREKDGSSAPIKSGDLRSKILGIETGADVSVVTATAPDVLSGKIIVDQDGNPVTGSMPNNGAGGGTISTKASTIAIPEGYYDGTGSVSISSTEQAKIKGANIATGVTLLGVKGTAKTYTVVSGSFTAEKTNTVTITNNSFKAGQTIVACLISGGDRYGDYTTYVLECYVNVNGTTRTWRESFAGDISSGGSVAITFADGSATIKYAYLNGTYNYTLLVQG